MSNVFWAAFGGAAAAGLVTLIALLTVEWFRRFLDRPLVNVKLWPGFIAGDKIRYLFYEAVNPHSKPVTLSSFGLLFKLKEWGKIGVIPQVGYQFPYQLDGGKSLSQWSDMQDLLATLKKQERTPRDLKWVYFQASSGKLYRSKIKKWVIEELEKELQKMNKRR